MAVNLRGPFLMAKHVAPHMASAGYGKIINIGSGTAFAASRDAALRHQQGRHHGDTRAMSRELGETAFASIR